MKNFKLNPDQTSLLLVDLQDRLVPALHQAEALVKQTRVLAETAQYYQIPILTTEQYPKGLGHTVAELNDYLNPAKVYAKSLFNALIPEIDQDLASSGRKQVIICGGETHICIFQTVRSLLEKDYQVFVPYDAVSSRLLENRQNALQMMREMGAVISNTETLLFDCLGQAGTDAFRALSPLIR